MGVLKSMAYFKLLCVSRFYLLGASMVMTTLRKLGNMISIRRSGPPNHGARLLSDTLVCSLSFRPIITFVPPIITLHNYVLFYLLMNLWVDKDKVKKKVPLKLEYWFVSIPCTAWQIMAAGPSWATWQGPPPPWPSSARDGMLKKTQPKLKRTTS